MTTSSTSATAPKKLYRYVKEYDAGFGTLYGLVRNHITFPFYAAATTALAWGYYNAAVSLSAHAAMSIGAGAGIVVTLGAAFFGIYAFCFVANYLVRKAMEIGTEVLDEKKLTSVTEYNPEIDANYPKYRRFISGLYLLGYGCLAFAMAGGAITIASKSSEISESIDNKLPAVLAQLITSAATTMIPVALNIGAVTLGMVGWTKFDSFEAMVTAEPVAGAQKYESHAHSM